MPMSRDSFAAGGLERRAVHARRRAHAGDLAGASADYAAMWPETKSLHPSRRIRFLGQYAGVLGRTRQCVLAFERIRLLAQEAEDLWIAMDCRRDEARRARRHLGGVQAALLKVVREVGDESAIGQTALQHVYTLASALGEGDRSPVHALKENGKTIWIGRRGGRYRLIRSPSTVM